MARTRVIAVQRGHDGAAVREAGEEFTVDVDDPRFKGSTWFVPTDKAPAPKLVDPTAQPPGAGPKRGSKAKADPLTDDTGGLA